MSITSLGFFEKWKLAPLYAKKAQEVGMPVKLLSDLDKIEVLEKAIEKTPDEWVYWYELADNHLASGSCVAALHACEKCLDLQPDDPRSTYAIATVYRSLTRAKFVNDPEENQKVLPLFARNIGLSFDAKSSEADLKEVGITVEEAARRSLQYFEKILKLHINKSEEQHIMNVLEELCKDFPFAKW